MDSIAALFGIGCAVTVLFAVMAEDAEWHDAVVASALLTGSWALSNIAWLMNMLGAFPLMDVGLATYFFFLALDRPRGWRSYVFACLLAQLCLHVAYACLGEGFYTPYAILLNALFGLQLISVSSTGLPHVAACLSRFSGRFRGPRHPTEP